ncbi:unnamed protein product [Symbiodinium sp. CCMP2592]|nr:unnamed protein product [Symbiodinium sp. CCMP2592]
MVAPTLWASLPRKSAVLGAAVAAELRQIVVPAKVASSPRMAGPRWRPPHGPWSVGGSCE